MKKLIICEKPSLARTVSNAINQLEECKYKNGYSESKNYIVVPAFGHLFTLKDVEEYTNEEKKWKLDNLPFIPTNFEFSIKKQDGIQKQFKLIKSLIHLKDVSQIVNCGDSDREGEIIIRIILNEAKNKKPIERLWLPDQTEKTILEQLKNMESSINYDSLANEGYARTYMDWLYGINLTRYASVKTGVLLKVGRVISTITKTIYDRDIEIKNFKKEKYYILESKEKTNDEVVKLTSKTKSKNQNDIKNLEKEYNSLNAVVDNIETKRKIVKSPKLFSQSTLQNALSQKYKYSPAETLSIVQSLYEKGFVSYPRTPTEYLATAEKAKAKSIIIAIQNIKSVDIIFKDTKDIFDDSKIESHSAIIPTTKIPVDVLSEKEQKCYNEILKRFCSVFYKKDCIEEITTIIINLQGKEIFNLKGTVSMQKGFKEIYKSQEEKIVMLPKLSIGDKVNTNFQTIEKETEPPKYYTVTTLNNYLKNPYRGETTSADEEYKAIFSGVEIGTEATRPGIIDNAIKSEYIILDKGSYKLLEKGKYYIETMEKLQIDVSKEQTVDLSKALKAVYNNEININKAVEITLEKISQSISKNISIEKIYKSEREILGICPICKKNIVEYNKSYSCENKDCDFSIWKVVAKKNLSVTQFKKLLTKGSTDKLKGFESKAGKKFDAYLILNDKNKTEFKF